MYSRIKKYMDQFVPFSGEEWAIIQTQLSIKKVGKKEVLVKEGEICREIFFINKGCLRYFYNKEGEEITGYIFLENLFASSYDSFLNQKPSIQVFETLEDSELIVLSYAGMQYLYQEVPRFQLLSRLITEQRFVNVQQILASFILDSPEERYIKLITHQPEIVARVPQHYIASYLGITPVSLSRIRQRISRQN